MDPNETLKQIRADRAELFANGEPYDPDVVRRLAENIDALDSWIVKGGFYPREWGPGSPF